MPIQGLDGRRNVLGLWAGTGCEGAKFFDVLLTEIRNRGTRDVLPGLRRIERPAGGRSRTYGRRPRFRPASCI